MMLRTRTLPFAAENKETRMNPSAHKCMESAYPYKADATWGSRTKYAFRDINDNNKAMQLICQ